MQVLIAQITNPGSGTKSWKAFDADSVEARNFMIVNFHDDNVNIELHTVIGYSKDIIVAETASDCARIASEVSNSYDKSNGFPSHHAVGAETVAVTIRRKFGVL